GVVRDRISVDVRHRPEGRRRGRYASIACSRQSRRRDVAALPCLRRVVRSVANWRLQWRGQRALGRLGLGGGRVPPRPGAATAGYTSIELGNVDCQLLDLQRSRASPKEISRAGTRLHSGKSTRKRLQKRGPNRSPANKQAGWSLPVVTLIGAWQKSVCTRA